MNDHLEAFLIVWTGLGILFYIGNLIEGIVEYKNKKQLALIAILSGPAAIIVFLIYLLWDLLDDEN